MADNKPVTTPLSSPRKRKRGITMLELRHILQDENPENLELVWKDLRERFFEGEDRATRKLPSVCFITSNLKRLIRH